MISANDIIEACAKVSEHRGDSDIAYAIRALKNKYGDTILCEREPVTHVHEGDSLDPIPLYRAKEPTK
jgi:hypothetical protein